MPPSPPPDLPVPLVVDLDGTVIRSDLLWESLARLLRRNPFCFFLILFWWTRGRAFLKRKLAARVKIAPATLPYNEVFLQWVRGQKSAGRKIILATASDLDMARPVADYLGIFDEVLASDGRTNLRGGNKLKVLLEKFGERGFDYAGNSAPDLAVWRGAREAIVVNAPKALARQAADCAKAGAAFLENYSSLFPTFHFLDELFIRSRYLAAVATGLLLAAAFPKPGIAGFAWVAPALILACAWRKSSGDAFRIGYAAGLSFWLASLYWLLLMPVTGYEILGWLALCAYLALFQAAWVWLLAGKIGEGNWARRNLWSILGAAAWVALEMLRARVFGGFPWSFIGVSQYRMTPLLQIASVMGVYGVSFLVVWTSLSLYSAVRQIFVKPDSRFAWQPEIFFPLFVVAGLFAVGEIKAVHEIPGAPTLRITLVQPSIPQTLIWDENDSTNRFRQLLQLSETALKESGAETIQVVGSNSQSSPPDGRINLLIWPESAVPDFSEENYIAITNLIRTHHVWLILNADDVVPRPNATNEYDNDDFNAAFLFDPDGLLGGIYHKQKLVPFGEYIPLAHWLPFVKWFTPITDGYDTGKNPVQFQMRDPDVVVSPLICFEDTFPELGRKAVQNDTCFLVNLTDDGWFGQSAEQWQHMANAVFRAVENGVPLVRCTNNGITCWIDANGRVRETLHQTRGSAYSSGFLTIDLPLQPHAQTFYNRHGDWFGWMCVCFASLVLAGRLLKWPS